MNVALRGVSLMAMRTQRSCVLHCVSQVSPSRVVNPVTLSVRHSYKFMSEAQYDLVAEETLQNLCDYVENLPDRFECSDEFDVSYSQGVLTMKLGDPHGTYVINKQSPNLQIWLSSPSSGPKRYDFVDGQWIYKHDGVSLHALFQKELCQIFNSSHISLTELVPKSK